MLDRIELASRQGRLRRHGTWTADQMAWHIGEFMRASIDGFGFRAPLLIRLPAALFRGFALGPRPTPRGIRLRGALSRFDPALHADGVDGVAHLRAQMDRVAAGERFHQPSPLFGPLTHEAWMRLHLKHVAHHFGHLEIVPAPGDRADTAPAEP